MKTEKSSEMSQAGVPKHLFATLWLLDGRGPEEWTEAWPCCYIEGLRDTGHCRLLQHLPKDGRA
jgi:hypothetical protein